MEAAWRGREGAGFDSPLGSTLAPAQLSSTQQRHPALSCAPTGLVCLSVCHPNPAQVAGDTPATSEPTWSRMVLWAPQEGAAPKPPTGSCAGHTQTAPESIALVQCRHLTKPQLFAQNEVLVRRRNKEEW